MTCHDAFFYHRRPLSARYWPPARRFAHIRPHARGAAAIVTGTPRQTSRFRPPRPSTVRTNVRTAKKWMAREKSRPVTAEVLACESTHTHTHSAVQSSGWRKRETARRIAPVSPSKFACHLDITLYLFGVSQSCALADCCHVKLFSNKWNCNYSARAIPGARRNFSAATAAATFDCA